MTQFRLDSDIEIGLSVGVTRARISIVGDNADKVLEEFAQLFTRDYVQPVLDSPDKASYVPPAPSPAPAGKVSEEIAANLKYRVIIGLKLIQDTSKAGKEYHYWTPFYDDQGGMKTIGRIMANGAIADQLRQIVPESDRPSKLNVFTPISPEYQFKAYYQLKDLPDGKKVSEFQYLEAIKPDDMPF